jgi:hypothetical protein
MAKIHPRVLAWTNSNRPYDLVAMLSGPRDGDDPRRNTNYGRWAKAVELASAYEGVTLIGSGHSSEVEALRRELSVVDRQLGLHRPRAKVIEDRSPHTAANVANLFRLGGVMYKFPPITEALLRRPITFKFVTNRFHGRRAQFLTDVIQRWLGIHSPKWQATLPFRIEFELVDTDDLETEWIQPYIDDEPRKMEESRTFAIEWFNGDLHRAPTMMRRVGDSHPSLFQHADTELALRQLGQFV